MGKDVVPVSVLQNKEGLWDILSTERPVARTGIRAMEISSPSNDPWDNSLSESLGTADGSQPQHEPLQTAARTVQALQKAAICCRRTSSGPDR